jgi:hypothetical protein
MGSIPRSAVLSGIGDQDLIGADPGRGIDPDVSAGH